MVPWSRGPQPLGAPRPVSRDPHMGEASVDSTLKQNREVWTEEVAPELVLLNLWRSSNQEEEGTTGRSVLSVINKAFQS